MRGPVQVATIAALGSFPADQGSLVYVQSVRCLWNFVDGSTVTADNITVVNGNGGRWFRRSLPDISWSYQANWFCNPSTGNDENDGSTSGTAIKTLAELGRRLNKQMLQQTTTVNLMGSYASEYLRLQDVRIQQNLANAGGVGPFFMIIQGDSSAWTTIFTSNVAGITSFQSVTRVAAGVRYAVTDTNLGGTDPATFIGHRIRLTSGTNTGATSWVLAKLSATQFATGPFIASVNLSTTAGASTIITPAAGDRYVIEDVVGVKGIEIIDGTGRPDMQDGSAASHILAPIFGHLDIGQGGTSVTTVADSNIMVPTIFPGVVAVPRTIFAVSRAASAFALFGAGTTIGCLFACPADMNINAFRMDSTCFLTVGAGVGTAVTVNTINPLGVVPIFANDCTSEGAGFAVRAPGILQVNSTGSLGLYNCVGVPVTVRPGTLFNCNAGIVYGTNPTCTGGCAMRVQSGGTLRISGANKPVVTAATPGTDDVQLNEGNFTAAWTAVPVNPPSDAKSIGDNTNDFGRKYLSNVTGNQGATGIFPGNPDKGLYSLDIYLAVKTAGAGGDTLTVTIAWTDDSQAESVNVFNAVSVGAKGFFQTRRLLETTGAANPTFAMTFTKTGAPAVSIRIVTRLLQNATA